MAIEWSGLSPEREWEYADVDLEENKALVRRYYQEVLTGRDRDLLGRLLDPSFVSHVPGVPATGRRVTVTGIHIHRIQRGRLTEHWEELDLLGALRQLGMSG